MWRIEWFIGYNGDELINVMEVNSFVNALAALENSSKEDFDEVTRIELVRLLD